jgi:hypothetical protein
MKQNIATTALAARSPAVDHLVALANIEKTTTNFFSCLLVTFRPA